MAIKARLDELRTNKYAMLKEHNNEVRKRNQEVLTTAPGTSRSNFSLAGSQK